MGTPYEDAGGVEESGAVHILYGSPGGLSASGAGYLHQDSPGVPGQAGVFDAFGLPLAAGDFNGLPGGVCIACASDCNS